MSRGMVFRTALVAAIAAGLLLVALNWQSLNPEHIHDWVRETGAWAPLIFMGLFALSAVLLVPATGGVPCTM